MNRISLTIRQFNNLVRFLKRLDDIGDAFYLVGDVICPCVRCAENKPGLHFVRNVIPIEQKSDVIYGIANLFETSKILGDVKGKKVMLFIDQSDDEIWVTANDVRVKLAERYTDEQIGDNPVPNGSFDALMGTSEFVQIPANILNSIKDGKVATFEDARKTTYVRLGKDLFKLRGSTRFGVPVKYEAGICIISPVSDENTLAINISGDNMGTVIIHFIEDFIEALHFYKFSPYH